jgi:hypothetical protein
MGATARREPVSRQSASSFHQRGSGRYHTDSSDLFQRFVSDILIAAELAPMIAAYRRLAGGSGRTSVSLRLRPFTF